MIASLLSVERLSVSYGRVPAVTEASISVGAGEIVTVIGANGAGKSTFVNALMGLLPSRGTVRLAGDAIQALPVEERVLRGLCLVPERRELFATMPVIDNLILGGWKSAAARNSRARCRAASGRCSQWAAR
jgi:branched-chain amino acid transport system ATP-binding protein